MGATSTNLLRVGAMPMIEDACSLSEGERASQAATSA
jgi:hypothetical protein